MYLNLLFSNYSPKIHKKWRYKVLQGQKLVVILYSEKVVFNLLDSNVCVINTSAKTAKLSRCNLF